MWLRCGSAAAKAQKILKNKEVYRKFIDPVRGKAYNSKSIANSETWEDIGRCFTEK
jgi:hypothetical protein